jgi:hypothetical protein
MGGGERGSESGLHFVEFVDGRLEPFLDVADAGREEELLGLTRSHGLCLYSRDSQDGWVLEPQLVDGSVGSHGIRVYVSTLTRLLRRMAMTIMRGLLLCMVMTTAAERLKLAVGMKMRVKMTMKMSG